MLQLTRSTKQEHLDRCKTFLDTLPPLRIQCLSILKLDAAIDAVNASAEFKALEAEIESHCQNEFNWSLLADACLKRDPARLADVHCPVNMPEMHPMFLRVLVSANVPVIGVPMAHIFRKMFPKGSAARTAHTVLKPYIVKSALLASTINKMMVCSLVGNYPHSCNRLNLESRVKVYEWFSAKPTSVFGIYVSTHKLLAKFPRLYTHVIRDHMVHLLEDDPIAFKHFNAKYDFVSFKSITQSAIEWIRRYIETNPVVPGAKLNTEWGSHLDRMHHRMLRCQTKSKQISFFQFLGEIRGQAPIRLERIHRQIDDSDIKVKIEEQPKHGFDDTDDNEDSEAKQEEQEEKEAEEEEALLETMASDKMSVAAMIRLMSLNEESIDSKRAKKTKVKFKENRRGVVLTKHGLPLATSAQVYECMRRLAEIGDSDTVLGRFLDSLAVLLGADRKGVTEMKKLWQIYKEDRTPDSSIRERVYHFSNVFPFTWALICAAWAARQFTTNIKLYKLDYSTMRNQLNALCKRFNCAMKDIPPAAFKMSICMGCQQPKIYTKDWNRATNKETYSFGQKEASIDLYTGKSYCRANKSFMHFRCGVQEIMHVDIIGHALVLKGRVYTHCPQPNGGHIAVLNPAHCKANEFTLSCYACTLDHEHDSLTRTINQHPYGPLSTNKCMVCDKKVVKLVNKHVYAKSTVLCQKCHSDALLHFLTRNLPVSVVENRMISENAEARIREAILKHRRTIKENWKEHNKNKNVAALKHAKKIQWAKSRN